MINAKRTMQKCMVNGDQTYVFINFIIFIYFDEHYCPLLNGQSHSQLLIYEFIVFDKKKRNRMEKNEILNLHCKLFCVAIFFISFQRSVLQLYHTILSENSILCVHSNLKLDYFFFLFHFIFESIKSILRS